MKFESILFGLLLLTCLTACSEEPPRNPVEEPTPTVAQESSAVEETGLTKVSIMYPFSEGNTFDMAYYESEHMPMVAGIIGDNLVKYTIERGVANGMPNTPLPFTAIGTFYVKDYGAYQAAIGPKRDSIRADFPNYTDILPVILVSEVVR